MQGKTFYTFEYRTEAFGMQGFARPIASGLRLKPLRPQASEVDFLDAALGCFG